MKLSGPQSISQGVSRFVAIVLVCKFVCANNNEIPKRNKTSKAIIFFMADALKITDYQLCNKEKPKFVPTYNILRDKKISC
jgi:ATP-dependent RNA circularization protein (DNA/RNA ligase family)